MGGTIVVLGDVGDNFGAGMTGGMGFIYDPENIFENKANPETIVWQKLETDRPGTSIDRHTYHIRRNNV